MLVYIVTCPEMLSIENTDILGVFDTKQSAIDYIKKQGDYEDIAYFIYSYMLNQPDSKLEIYS